jgi:hypothetical protein
VSEQNNMTIREAGTTGADAPLSPHRAFVVQFREPGEARSKYFVGRVEHIVSGQAIRFSSTAELLAFIDRVLTEVTEAPP